MKLRIVVILTFVLITLSRCNKFLEIQPLDKVSSSQLLDSEGGFKTLLAGLYNSIPMEDFTYRPNTGFNQRGWAGVDYMINTSFLTDESTRSDGDQGIGPWDFQYWPYDRIREVNLFFDNLEVAKNKGVLDAQSYDRLKSEAHFIRAYIYFGLVKRYGGIPLIDRVLDDDYVPGKGNENLFIARNTEKESWEFVLKELDLSVQSLPEIASGEDGVFRATKWAAYGLKSRVALHAASVAKYWSKAPLGGEAAAQNLVGGMTDRDADFFYNESLKASKEIIDHSGKALYKANPASVEEAAQNFHNLFITANEEVIFSKSYLDGTKVSDQGHSFDIYYSPSQANPGYHKFGRFNPTLNIVDLYEDYTDNGLGESAKIETRTDGNEEYVVSNPKDLNLSIPFKKYSSLYEPFKDKDARLLASVIVPGAVFKNTTIIIQGGMIKTNGSVLAYADGYDTGLDGKRYYAFGGESNVSYSGFYGIGRSDDANFSSTGFTIRKYLQEGKSILGQENSSTTSFIDIRLGEIYLNYAEAVVESGSGDANLAKKLMNDLRKRAGHKDEIPLTLPNVLKERQVELAFEGLRYWDLIRRRDYHLVFNSSRRLSLVPMIDLRESTPKYIFVRANNYYDEYAGGRTFQSFRYYLPIPGRNTNNLIQNPQYQ